MRTYQLPLFDRVRRRIPIRALESPRGYLCHAANAFGFAHPGWFIELAGLKRLDNLDDESAINQISKVLCLSPEEWRRVAYLRIASSRKFSKRNFFAHPIAADRINYGSSRVCVPCLCETPIWWGIWDLTIISACPGHRCELISNCPQCGRKLTWRRPGVELCRCGFDLRRAEAIEAQPELVAINAAVYKSAGFPVGIGSFDLGSAGFPAGMADMALDDLIGLIIAFASLQRRDNRSRKPALTDLGTAMSIACQAAHVLKEWPSCFHERLCALLPNSPSERTEVTFRGVYGDFYQYLLDAAHQAEFKFLTDAFDEFVTQYWPGVVRGQHRLIPQLIHDQLRWIPARQAARLAGLPAPYITDLVRKEKLTGTFISPPKSRSHVECWLNHDDLSRWIADRDSDFRNFMSQQEAIRILGLTRTTLGRLVNSGLLKTVKGPDQGFPPGVHVRRNDVDCILAAFSIDRTEPEIHGNAILLREALRLYLTQNGLADFIRAVISGDICPIACVSSVAGILGYRFLIEDVKKYSPGKPKHLVPSGLVTYATAAAALKTNTEVVRNLVAMGLLQCHRAPSGGPLLLSAREVESFSSKYVTVKSIAERFEVASRTVSELLNRKGADVLVVPLPGKGNKLFVKKGPKSEMRKSEVRQSSCAPQPGRYRRPG